MLINYSRQCTPFAPYPAPEEFHLLTKAFHERVVNAKMQRDVCFAFAGDSIPLGVTARQTKLNLPGGPGGRIT